MLTLLVLVVVNVNTGDGAPSLIGSSDADEAVDIFVGDMALNGMQFGASLSETDVEQGLFGFDAEIGPASKRRAPAAKAAAVKAAAAKRRAARRKKAAAKKAAGKANAAAAKAAAAKRRAAAAKEAAAKKAAAGKKEAEYKKAKKAGCPLLFRKGLLVWRICSLELGLRHS